MLVCDFVGLEALIYAASTMTTMTSTTTTTTATATPTHQSSVFKAGDRVCTNSARLPRLHGTVYYRDGTSSYRVLVDNHLGKHIVSNALKGVTRSDRIIKPGFRVITPRGIGVVVDKRPTDGSFEVKMEGTETSMLVKASDVCVVIPESKMTPGQVGTICRYDEKNWKFLPNGKPPAPRPNHASTTPDNDSVEIEVESDGDEDEDSDSDSDSDDDGEEDQEGNECENDLIGCYDTI
jgi:hypothetical protein